MSIKDHLIKLTMWRQEPKKFEITGQGGPPPCPPSVSPLVFTFVPEGFTFWNFTKAPPIYSQSLFYLGCLALCLGANPQKPTRGDGTDEIARWSMTIEKCLPSKKCEPKRTTPKQTCFLYRHLGNIFRVPGVFETWTVHHWAAILCQNRCDSLKRLCDFERDSELSRGTDIMLGSSTSSSGGDNISQWCRRLGCKRTHKSFDLSKIRTKSQWIRAQKFRHSVTILLKWLLGFACIKICLLYDIKGSGYRSVTSHAFRIKCWVCHFNGIFMVM